MLKRLFANRIKAMLATVLAIIIGLSTALFAFSGCSNKDNVKPDDGTIEDGTGGGNGGDGGNGGGGDNQQEQPKPQYEPFYRYDGKIGYSGKVIGTVARQTPEESNEGLAVYPEYGTVLYGRGDANAEEKAALIAENALLCAGANTYDSMDSEGNLYLNGEATGRKLYKHTASKGMYLGDVSDDEQAVVKEIALQARRSGNHITGLYAPAGEVIKVEISQEDLAKTGGVTVEIGQALSNGQANNIWAAREINRMPVILNTMTVNATQSYVGSYLGGPIYIKPVNRGTKFTVTISGGVEYSHFILGYTTREEFKQNATSSAPYFDLEVWDDSVRFSGPVEYAKNYSYDELTDAAELWEKFSSVSNQVPSGSADIGINFLFDCFVAAGAAVAFVGRNTVNCPLDWMRSVLNYKQFTTTGGWGNIHEYNHHYQRFGLEGNGSYPSEVTNNVVSLISYSLFTDISSARTKEGGLSDWNRYTDPAWALKQTIATAQKGNANYALDAYANILYSFGQDALLSAIKYGKGAIGVDIWFKALCESTRHDMTYYFTQLLNQTVSESVLNEIAQKDYPMYVPVATVYETGGLYRNGDETVEYRAVRPFKVNAGSATVLDFSSEIVIPEGFSYRVKSLSSPEYGTLEKGENGVYVYTPDPKHKLSGEMTLTLEITKDDGEFKVEDKKIIIELQTGANDKVLERTVYTYSSNVFASAQQAYESGYVGYESVNVEDNVNPVQNGNAEIWVPDPSNNAVMEIKGKIYIESDGNYRIAVRGRKSVALYTSKDGVNYTLSATLENKTDDKYHLEEENSYSDFALKAGETLYFKAVLLVNYSRAYVGVGWGKFNGEEVQVSHLTGAYRNSAEVGEKFVSEKYYPRNYGSSVTIYQKVSPVIVETNYAQWDENYKIENLFDENETNFIHSNKTNITAENPFEMTVDLGKSVTANCMTIVGEPSRKYQPKNFSLYGGTDLDDMKLLCSVENAARTGDDVIVNFDECEMRYYKLVVTDTYAGNIKYIAMRTIELSYSLFDGALLSPFDDEFTYRGNWRLDNTLSTFGKLLSCEDGSVEFEFTGTRFALFSVFGSDFDGFEVYIDGEKVEEVALNDGEGKEGASLAYLSARLEEGKHVVEIRSEKSFNIDSVGIWE